MRIRMERTMVTAMLLFVGASLMVDRLAAEMQMPIEAAIARKDDSGISWSELTIARALLAGNAVEPSAAQTDRRSGESAGNRLLSAGVRGGVGSD